VYASLRGTTNAMVPKGVSSCCTIALIAVNDLFLHLQSRHNGSNWRSNRELLAIIVRLFCVRRISLDLIWVIAPVCLYWLRHWKYFYICCCCCCKKPSNRRATSGSSKACDLMWAGISRLVGAEWLEVLPPWRN